MAALSGCAIIIRRPAFPAGTLPSSAPSCWEELRLVENCGPLGTPRIPTASTDRIGPTRRILYPEFVLEYCLVEKVPLWVAECVTPAEVAGNIPRVNWFFSEPSLGPGQRAELCDFWLSGYQMGHMAAAGNQTVSPERKLETFTLANIVPQNIPQNLEIWDNLEDVLRACARHKPVYMITGPMFWDPAEEDPRKADGMVERHYIGAGMVAVPTHIYKIAARMNDAGKWELIAFVIANDDRFPRPWNLADYIVPVDFVEARTGLDFFPEGGFEIERAEAERSKFWNATKNFSQ